MRGRRIAALALVASCARPAPTPAASTKATSTATATATATTTSTASSTSTAPSTSTATTRATAAPAPVTVLGELHEVARVPAWDAVLAGGTLFVVDPGADSVSGFAAGTGARRFQTTTEASTIGGRHTLHVRGGDVRFWAGDRMNRIDVASGKLLSTEAVPPNGDCSFEESGTACAFACSCSVRLAACESGKPIGHAFEKTYVEMFGGHGEEPHAGCYGSGVGLIGGGAGVAVLEVEDQTSNEHRMFGRPHVIVGVDAVTGVERWRSRALAQLTARDSGVVGDRAYRAGSDGDLDIFDVRDGRLVYHRPAARVEGYVPRRLTLPDVQHGRVFHAFEQEALLIDARQGAVVWRTALPADAWGVLEGATVRDFTISMDDKALFVSILDQKTGRVRATIPLPARASVYAYSPAGFYVMGTDLVSYDARGTERARLTAATPPNLRVGTDFAALSAQDALTILDGRDLHRVSFLAGHYAIQPGSALSSQLVLYRYVDKGQKPGEAIVLSR